MFAVVVWWVTPVGMDGGGGGLKGFAGQDGLGGESNHTGLKLGVESPP